VSPIVSGKEVFKNLIPALKARFFNSVQMYYDSINTETLNTILKREKKVSVKYFKNFLDLEVTDSAFKDLLLALEPSEFEEETQELIYYIKMRLDKNLLPLEGMSDETISLIWSSHLVRKDN
jgi:hypothetical protein